MDKIQFEYLRGLLEAMAKQQYPPSKGFRVGDLKDNVHDLMFQFEQEWKAYQDEAKTKAERQKIEKNLENFAKALPGVTKGTISAVTAFQKGDNISGSAAIMDICASLAPLLAGLSSAGGPPGMIVGAIFSMVGQILSLFAPQSESLTSKIEKLLRDLEAEKTEKHIAKVHLKITVYADSLRQAAKRAAKETNKDAPLLNVEVTKAIIKLMNPLEGTTTDDFRDVLLWLNNPKNQTLDLWPVILSAACQAWADMMSAALTLLSYTHTHQVQRQYETAKKLTDSEEASQVKKALIKLQAEVIARLIVIKGNNDRILGILQQLVPAAQNRGMFWMVGTNAQLYAGTNIKEGEFSPLGGELKSLSVVIPKKDTGSSHPTYYQVGLESWQKGAYDRTYISEIKPPYKKSVDKQLLDEKGDDDQRFHSLSDVWAEPGDQPNNLWLYTAKGSVITGYGVEIEKGMDKARPTGFSRTLKADVKSVRVLHNPEAFLDDPDNTPDIMAGVAYCVYGGLVRENSEIYAAFGEGKSGYVPSPWGGYDGIRVDRHYLWVFGSGGFACATHASVMRCLKGEIRQPRWMQHLPTQLLYAPQYHTDEGKVVGHRRRPLVGLVDMCPCDDGTLVAAIYTRSVIRQTVRYKVQSSFRDTNALYTAAYQTDLKKGSINVDWTKIEVSEGVRVHKLPVFCWPLFAGLPVMLNELAPQLDAL